MKRSEFASDEEYQFFHWLVEAQRVGLVQAWQYESRSFSLSPKQTRPVFKRLKTKLKQEDKHLLNPHIYTPDFMFAINRTHPLAPLILKHLVISTDGLYWIDTKGTFNPHGGDRIFSINQKWVYTKYRVFINKVVPEKFFKKLWVPEAVAIGKKEKPLKKWLKYKKMADL